MRGPWARARATQEEHDAQKDRTREQRVRVLGSDARPTVSGSTAETNGCSGGAWPRAGNPFRKSYNAPSGPELSMKLATSQSDETTSTNRA
eukprot:1559341-Lingulodinium_polyedra.AAC.1